jgi:alkyl hydroperoxide reductase subunit AhpC
LCDHQSEFAELDTRILIISFGTFPAVQQWLQETCGDFTVLLDRERTVYSAYGLERSYWRSRNLKTRWVYFKAWLAGKETHDSHGDDTSQLGGDFIVDKSGNFQFIHPSHDPTDRPSVDILLDVLKSL